MDGWSCGSSADTPTPLSDTIPPCSLLHPAARCYPNQTTAYLLSGCSSILDCDTRPGTTVDPMKTEPSSAGISPAPTGAAVMILTKSITKKRGVRCYSLNK